MWSRCLLTFRLKCLSDMNEADSSFSRGRSCTWSKNLKLETMTFAKECRKCCDVFSLQPLESRIAVEIKQLQIRWACWLSWSRKKKKKKITSQQFEAAAAAPNVLCLQHWCNVHCNTSFPACCVDEFDEPQLFRWSLGFATYYIRDFPLQLRLGDVGTTQLLKKQDF